MALGHYISNVRDIEFNLFEVLKLGDVLASGGYGDLDADTVRTMLDEVARLAEGPVAESFADADRNPPTFDPATGAVTLPESFKQSYAALNDGQGWRLVLGVAVWSVVFGAALRTPRPLPEVRARVAQLIASLGVLGR